MSIEEVKELIQTTKDKKILEALWELYDLKKQNFSTKESFRTYLNSGKPFREPYRG